MREVIHGQNLFIDRVNQLGLQGLDGGAAHVVAPDGTVVLRADGVRARGDVTAIVRSVLFGTGPITIPIRFASAPVFCSAVPMTAPASSRIS